MQSPEPIPGAKAHPATRLAVFAGVALWLALAFWFAGTKAATVDEFPYFGAGLSNIAYFDFRMNPEHPPLIKVLGTLPVYLFDRPLMHEDLPDGTPRYPSPWYRSYPGDYGFYLMCLADDHSPMRRIFLMRLVPILIGLLGGWFAFLWGRALAGSVAGGLAAAGLLLFYPEYLGQSCMLSLDAPLLVSCAAISWCARGWWVKPGVRSGAWLCLAVGIGSLVKLPATVFALLTLLLLTAMCVRGGEGRPRFRGALLLLAAGLSIYTFQWIGAGFRFSYVPADAEIHFLNPLIPRYIAEPANLKEAVIKVLWRGRLLPETTLATLTFTSILSDWPKYLMGVENKDGFYSYFLVTFVLKTPLLYVAAAGLLVWQGSRRLGDATWRRGRAALLPEVALLAVPFLLILAIVVLSRINIGHRHILFAYFPLSVMLGALSARWIGAGGWRRGAAVALLAGQLGSTLWGAPHFTTYFNLLTRNPYNAMGYVADSNTDGGQDISLLGRRLNALGYDCANLALWGMNMPDDWGIETYRMINPKDKYPLFPYEIQPPDPAWPTAISVNHLASIRALYPGQFDGEPDLLVNSIVVYLPSAAAESPEAPAAK